jgi:hypothetical protein
MWLKANLAPPAAATAPLGSTTYVKPVIDIEAESVKPTGAISTYRVLVWVTILHVLV